jgi:glycosyltransferase involved in cell wall biosynthesis
MAGIEKMPRVSIILPFYNRPELRDRCISSVLAQTFADFELIVVDDGSTDRSTVYAGVISDGRIREIRHNRNRGPAAARNTGIRAAQGAIIALIDSDDEWLPTKLARQVALLDERAADLCVCEYFLVEGTAVRHRQLPEPASWREDLHFRCELGNGTTLAVRRRVIDAVGLLDENLRLYEDWDWVLRMLADHSLHVLHEPLARIYAGPPRPSTPFEQSAAHFLAKHAAEFQRLGRAHHRRVRAAHFRYVAENAFANRRFVMGCNYLRRSFRTMPWQNPLRLGALVLAPIDAFYGTSLVARAAEWQRSLFAPR